MPEGEAAVEEAREPGGSALGASFLTAVMQLLVRTPSANPGELECAMARTVTSSLAATAAEVSTVEFAPGRPSIAAVIDSGRPGPTLVLNGHTDTVAVGDEELWSYPPHGAEVSDGHLYGRGACDMKAGLAVQIALAHHFSRPGAERLHGRLILQFAAGEERGEPGTLALIEAGFKGDYGVVLEPTNLRVATATRGVARYRIQIAGRACHASRPELGVNPIWALGPVLEVLEQYDAEVKAASHPLLPPGTCTPTMVSGGIGENVVPGSCELVIDRRLLPGESPELEAARIERRIADRMGAAGDDDFALRIDPMLMAAGAEVPADGPFVVALMRAVESRLGTAAEPWGAPFGSDVRNLVNDAGMEAVTFGPGDLSECHCPDERVRIADVEAVAGVLASVVTGFLTEEA